MSERPFIAMNKYIDLFYKAFFNTLYMFFLHTVIGYCISIPRYKMGWSNFTRNCNCNYKKVSNLLAAYDGDVPIDDNASERAIRGFCVGKKNWQVIDTINGAASSAINYSIAETGKANNLKPYDYFEYLLTELPKHADDHDRNFLEDLLP